MNYHTGDPSQTCQTCDKTFSKNAALRKHIIEVHEKLRSLSCDLCYFKTFNNYKLNRHKKTHENVTETCLICNAEVKSVYHHYRNSHSSTPEAWADHQKLQNFSQIKSE